MAPASASTREMQTTKGGGTVDNRYSFPRLCPTVPPPPLCTTVWRARVQRREVTALCSVQALSAVPESSVACMS